VLSIACGLAEFGKAIAGLKVESAAGRSEWLRQARESYVKFSTPVVASAGKFVDMSAVMAWLNDHLAEDAIVTNGAGNYTVWVHRYFRYRKPCTELAPTSGAMGYGVPAAIAASLRYPQRQVVAFAGDGCFMMYPQELCTASQHGAKLVVIIVNNGTYGTIRMHQERRYPGRVVGTDLANPDFIGFARSCGAFAERVTTTETFADAFMRASAAGRPAVLELIVDPAQLAPTFRIAG
jgi:acetolactate synthase I/II/III large subunit